MNSISLNQLRKGGPFFKYRVFQSMNMVYLPVYLGLLKHCSVKFYTFIWKVFAYLVIFIIIDFFFYYFK